MLSFKRLFLSPKQKMLIKEEYQYEYDKDLLEKGKEIPVKTNDHCQDATRYLIMGIWKFIRRLLPMIDITEEGDDSDT